MTHMLCVHLQSRKRKRTVLEGDSAANTASDPFYAKPAGMGPTKLQDAGSEEQPLSGDEGSDGEDDSALEAFADPAAVETQRRAAIQVSLSLSQCPWPAHKQTASYNWGCTGLNLLLPC